MRSSNFSNYSDITQYQWSN